MELLVSPQWVYDHRSEPNLVLLDATLRLIGDRGLHAITLREVAGAAGLSLGSTTYHFADRDALLIAALSRFADSVTDQCDEAIAAADLDTLAAYADLAPGMPYAHPTVEHYSPLFVALGAGSDENSPADQRIDGYWMGLSKRSLQVA